MVRLCSLRSVEVTLPDCEVGGTGSFVLSFLGSYGWLVVCVFEQLRRPLLYTAPPHICFPVARSGCSC